MKPASDTIRRKPFRTSLACLSCRKIKCRCIPTSIEQCQRCQTLGLACSLAPISAPALLRDAKSLTLARDGMDVVNLGIFTTPEVVSLLKVFVTSYDRWVTFPAINPNDLRAMIVAKSSLLLSVCCMLALRQTPGFYPAGTSHRLINLIMGQLQDTILLASMEREHIQALLLISLYGPSLSTYFENQEPFDVWNLTGISIQAYIMYTQRSSHQPADELLIGRLWNHIVVTHLITCLRSSRPCLVNEKGLQMCRKTLELPAATNFDGRMYAETSLYLNLYNIVQENLLYNEGGKEELETWKADWDYLYEQDNAQYLEIGYYYAHAFLLRKYLSHKVDLDLLESFSMAIIRKALSVPVSDMSVVSDHVLQIVIQTASYLNNTLSDKTVSHRCWEFLDQVHPRWKLMSFT